jgi:hypothetical protein
MAEALDTSAVDRLSVRPGAFQMCGQARTKMSESSELPCRHYWRPPRNTRKRDISICFPHQEQLATL